ncbi:MAG: aminotransferase class I/II-fold pyridoxal phosphate-dependent enzyme, partial [Deltaproteobacteria bacterium]|nr:aminotransferase class I/II-fold pyridoxal phosphate-dependent enzyme [Deltaproteobacteria bacterium]
LVAASEAATHGEGVGAAASRLITGTMDAHRDAEVAYADFVGTPAAVLFSTGYAANVGTVQALAGPGDVVFSDTLNHASLIDGCRLSRAKVYVYAHRDAEHLESLLREHRLRSRRALIVTDSLFSMDGTTAPLRDLEVLARRFDAGLLVDEAHALGVFGPSGRGLAAAQGVEPDVLVGTLGKSFGVAGAFVAASEEVVSLIRNRARSFVYSTAPPPLLARAAIAALTLVRGADAARESLLSHADKLRSELRLLGFEVPDGDSQILPVLIGENKGSSCRGSGHPRFRREPPDFGSQPWLHIDQNTSTERSTRLRRSAATKRRPASEGRLHHGNGHGSWEDMARHRAHARVRSERETRRRDQADRDGCGSGSHRRTQARARVRQRVLGERAWFVSRQGTPRAVRDRKAWRSARRVTARTRETCPRARA